MLEIVAAEAVAAHRHVDVARKALLRPRTQPSVTGGRLSAAVDLM
jgi:hypothetical protein